MAKNGITGRMLIYLYIYTCIVYVCVCLNVCVNRYAQM